MFRFLGLFQAFLSGVQSEVYWLYGFRVFRALGCWALGLWDFGTVYTFTGPKPKGIKFKLSESTNPKP